MRDRPPGVRRRSERPRAVALTPTKKSITPDGVYKLVRHYSALFGFEIGARTLRATAATNALDNEADIAKVQEWLGHANISTTRIYDHQARRSKSRIRRSRRFQGIETVYGLPVVFSMVICPSERVVKTKRRPEREKSIPFACES